MHCHAVTCTVMHQSIRCLGMHCHRAPLVMGGGTPVAGSHMQDGHPAPPEEGRSCASPHAMCVARVPSKQFLKFCKF